MTRNKVCLIVRDGWGYTDKKEGNAISSANTPFDDYLNTNFKPVLLYAHGPHVGLPKGFQGSSEVGHMNMGAGTIVKQEVTRINEMLESGEFYKSKNFMEISSKIKNPDVSIHLMGLLQDEGVHSHQQHLFLLIKYFAKHFPQNKIYIHVFADGRDTPPKSGVGFLKQLQNVLNDIPNSSIATVQGRYYAMDRSKSWDLTAIAYNAICYTKGEKYSSLYDTIKDKYENEKTPDNQPMCDEYLKPLIAENYSGAKNGDVLINFNYRQDRAIQISKAFLDKKTLQNVSFLDELNYYGFTQYYDEFNNFLIEAITSADSSPVLVGKIISDAGLKQLRLSETQKFRHVTSFFNGKLTKPFPLEEQIEVPGEFEPSTFASHPQMNAKEITEEVIKQLDNNYSFVLINYANCDMVGHTGNFEAAKTGAEIVDKNVEIITKKMTSLGYNVLITADHGNSEEMIDFTSLEPKTSHTLNPVKLHLVSDEYKISCKNEAVLGDIGTLILRLMQLEIPKEMDLKNIILETK